MTQDQRVPYTALTADEKAALHAWFDAHGVDHRRVPINPELTINQGYCAVRLFKWLDDGKSFIGDDDEPAIEWVTFQPTSPMPWRSAGRSEGVDPMTAEDQDRTEMHDHGMVVPFVVVESKGGPFHDESFAAGYQVGEIDARLAFANMAGAETVKFPIVRRALVPQLDLHGMRYGFTSMTVSETSDHIPASDFWCSVTFSRGEVPHGE